MKFKFLTISATALCVFAFLMLTTSCGENSPQKEEADTQDQAQATPKPDAPAATTNTTQEGNLKVLKFTNGQEIEAEPGGFIDRLYLFLKQGEGEPNFIMDKVGFQAKTAELTEESHWYLANLAVILAANPDRNVMIISHTDDQGESEQGHALTHERAEAVRIFLEENGAEGGLIEIMGKGADEPLYDNGTEEGRAKNNRLEIQVL